MSLSESIFKVAQAAADRKRQAEADAKQLANKEQRKRLWEAFNAACEYVPRGPAEAAARTWASLLIAACGQLKAAGEVGRLEAVRYKGSDRLRMAAMEAAYRVCQFTCADEHAEVRTALRTLIEAGADLDSPFRLYLECVRDNRCWWMTASTPGGDAK
jgi:hypothetical protein